MATSAPRMLRLGSLLARQAAPSSLLQQQFRTFSDNAAAEAAKAAPEAVKADSGSKGKIRGVQALIFGGLGAGMLYGYSLFTSQPPPSGPLAGPPTLPTGTAPKTSTPGDYAAVRDSISSLLEAADYDDGSYGPLLVRLAWHASGTYDKSSCTGGSNGATMRFPPECEWAANRGLAIARQLLEPVKAAHPWISYADLWTLAGVVAIEDMGGPSVAWRPGREDYSDGSKIVPDGRLPNATLGAKHLRDIFHRMGFDDRDIVALSGAHTLGRCHPDRSGFSGPWTNAPTTFSNLYFQELVNNKWRPKKWDGPLQYEDAKTGTLMMLPTDLALLSDRTFKKYVAQYAKDEEAFFKDFAVAFGKLLELGVPFPSAEKAAATS
ncbi:L-ascorbate peroxidase [Volvox carteri f. nagariensis]|uniref:Cytochrome c peroxidase, mitochondrial n=1 Tax=Volvox carteri f. nagariensis TaxID=3068 RepID=D8UGR8_VOLCA|nr:L-ascorbate peroxidase [Volvox carteri f. nagariensis]EFJ41098.1 L-ascorbate peroxidase [Volvox carteri f. nagariensis]|eukprot:XP_002957861.1 L-ascorbate peroxidase [Volvox carteri f. nagariensis]